GQLGLEGMALSGTGRMIVVEVETGLPHRHHSRIPQHTPEPGFGGGAPVASIVRVDAGRGEEPGLGPGQLERSLSPARRLTDDNYLANPGGPGPIQHLLPIGLVGRVSEVAVGVD
ncbi:MAG: hypothetical protein QOH59_3190, partial [Gemmatimonadales bacterium]|nr:hypothetical protein [Gemmatimonadales bacterium]